MGKLVGMLLGGLLTILSTLVGRVLLALGIGYVAYSGIDTGIIWARDLAMNTWTGMPITVMQLAGLLQIDTAFSIWFSAMLARITISGIAGSAKMVVKK